MTDTIKNYVNGTLVDSASSTFLDLVDPVTGSVDGVVPVSLPSEVDAAYAAAARASLSWKRLPPSARQKYLLDIADSVAQRRDELAELQSRDTGQQVRHILSEEIDQGVDQLRFFAGAARLLEGKSSGEYLAGHTSSIRREPIGVVGQVTPWNYPFAMAIWKIAPALAAGNTIVLKPSETTPRSTVLLAEIVGDIVPAGVLNVVNGDATTGRALVEHGAAGLVAITGSVRAGVEVALSAAQSVTRVHLELGGKAPAVVWPDADLPAAAAAIAGAAYFNGGQDCTAATRVIVHESVHDEFVELLVAEAASTTPGHPADTADYGPLNNESHFEKVRSFFVGVPEHVTVRIGGHRVGEQGYLFAPTVITGVKQDDRLVQEEVFGPVLTVQRFDTAQQALGFANGVPYGLAASVWTKDHGTAEFMTRELDFGCVWINTHIPFVSEMPHGGFGVSGYGKDLSGYGFDDYTRIKHVMSAHY
ncbi:aldehyde dehydrogenase family protein [Rhodococcus sp. IEGM1428]|uniref:aldehyde dehydrogenase family protein n=1 Tax=Rhodococcus sp. IEGM1428 TaxID=3392191 RepID=UPI003D112810